LFSGHFILIEGAVITGGFPGSILIGGGMCFTFLKIKGLEIGQSLFDAESQDAAREIMELAKETG
jgi:3-phosphoglycerate kinase